MLKVKHKVNKVVPFSNASATDFEEVNVSWVVAWSSMTRILFYVIATLIIFVPDIFKVTFIVLLFSKFFIQFIRKYFIDESWKLQGYCYKNLEN